MFLYVFRVQCRHCWLRGLYSKSTFDETSRKGQSPVKIVTPLSVFVKYTWGCSFAEILTYCDITQLEVTAGLLAL